MLSDNGDLRGFWEQISNQVVVRRLSYGEMAKHNRELWVLDCRELPTGSHYAAVYAELLGSLEAEGAIHPDCDILVPKLRDSRS